MRDFLFFALRRRGVGALLLLSGIFCLVQAASVRAAEPWRRVDSALGPTYVLEAPAFSRDEGVDLAQTPASGTSYLSFRGEWPSVASIEFSLPEGGRHALVLRHDGMPRIRFTINAFSHEIAPQGDTLKGFQPLYVTTYAFLETVNEIAIMGADMGKISQVQVSKPLVRLRDLSMHRNVLETRRHMLAWLVETEVRGNEPGAVGVMESLTKRLRSDLRAWDAAFLALHKTCEGIAQGRVAEGIGAEYNRLLGILDRIDGEIGWIHSEYAKGQVLNPAAFRLTAGMPDADTFRHFPWWALRTSHLNTSKDELDRLRLLAIDALSLATCSWPDPRMAELASEEQFWCILRHDRILDGATASDELAGSPYNRRYAHALEVYLRELISPYRGNPGVLAIGFDGSPPPGRDFFEGVPASIGSRSARAPMKAQLAYRSFAEDRHTTYLRDVNRILAQNAPDKPRIGFFVPGPDSPAGASADGTLNAFEMMLDSGYPTVGMPTGADGIGLAWAISLAQSDPHRRGWWELRLPLGAGKRSAQDLRLDIWRLTLWGLRNIEFDAGPNAMHLYKGAPDAGLLHEDIVHLASLKRSVLALDRQFVNSRVVAPGICLLETGLPNVPESVRRIAHGWDRWFRDRRLPPLWKPRGTLARPQEASFFDSDKVLMAPGPLVMHPATGLALQEWVRQGGILIATDPMGYYTTDGEPVNWTQQLLGVPVERIEEGLFRLPHEVRPKGNAEILQADGQGRPTIVLAPFGKGYVLVGMGEAAQGEVWDAVMDRLILFALPMRPMRCDMPADRLELVLRQAEGGERFLGALNPSATQSVRAQVELLGEYPKVLDITHPTAVALPANSGNGVTYLSIDLQPAQAAVFALGRNVSRLSAQETREALGRLGTRK